MVGSDEANASGQAACPITPGQCRAARALLDWSTADLASRSGFDEGLVRDFEGGLAEMPSGRVEALRSCLMTAGVTFTGNGDDGVRLGRSGAGDGTRLDDLTTENDR